MRTETKLRELNTREQEDAMAEGMYFWHIIHAAALF